MTVHISNEDVAAFRGHELSPERLLTIDDHLINCPDCRVKVADMPAFAQAVHELENSTGLSLRRGHLTYNQLESYADKQLVGTELAAADAHLGACEDCMSEI